MDFLNKLLMPSKGSMLGKHGLFYFDGTGKLLRGLSGAGEHLENFEDWDLVNNDGMFTMMVCMLRC